MFHMEDRSFLAGLLEKLELVKHANQAGVKTAAAEKEVHRQIMQALQGQEKGILKGEGVTKSGDED